jgi:hypothetical protein
VFLGGATTAPLFFYLIIPRFFFNSRKTGLPLAKKDVHFINISGSWAFCGDVIHQHLLPGKSHEIV